MIPPGIEPRSSGLLANSKLTRSISAMVTVFHTNDSKMVLDISLLNTQHYKAHT